MATIDPGRRSFEGINHARTFRHARCYAPDAAMNVLRPLSTVEDLAIIIDIDALERSTLARVDRVMQLAIDSLAQAGTQIVLVAHYERERAARLQPRIASSLCFDATDGSVLARVRNLRPGIRVALITDQPDLLAEVSAPDCGIALGRPELVSTTIAAMAESAVRATLWWLYEERTRHLVA